MPQMYVDDDVDCKFNQLYKLKSTFCGLSPFPTFLIESSYVAKSFSGKFNKTNEKCMQTIGTQTDKREVIITRVLPKKGIS